MGSITAYELGQLYSKLPLGREFTASQFATNPEESRRIGKMLTELEKAGMLISKNGNKKKVYEVAEEVVRDCHNMAILRCLNNTLMQNAKRFSQPEKLSSYQMHNIKTNIKSICKEEVNSIYKDEMKPQEGYGKLIDTSNQNVRRLLKKELADIQ